MQRIEIEYGRKLLSTYLKEKNISISNRQSKLLNFFVKSEKNFIFISDYQKKYKVSYKTARNDLNELAELGFLQKDRQGRKNIYKFIVIGRILKEINC
ncbi:MAG: DeoR family transcriptional regulator [Halanaerobiales bacterium]|nr:DeoR family transcriptional regulator [Halanaerobiales bacterium]